MRTKVILVLFGAVAGLTAGLALSRLRPLYSHSESPQTQPPTLAEPTEPVPPPAPTEPVAASRQKAPIEAIATPPPPQTTRPPLTKAERLAQVRETFRALAGGDPRTALRTARPLTDEVERETALLALLTEWKHGELDPPRKRAWAIASLGLEGGLGAELAGNPGLAQLWTNELSGSQSRGVSPDRLAAAMVEVDPAGALALSEQVSPSERRRFIDSLYASWAYKDTEAALQWAEQLPDPTERDAALNAIRSAAPVGIGVELRLQEGYPVINRLLPGTPADLTGQLQPGDRIVALAQGDNVFKDASGAAMQDIVQAIRGTPGTLIQLQVLPADAPPGSPPRTVNIVRGQIKYKR